MHQFTKTAFNRWAHLRETSSLFKHANLTTHVASLGHYVLVVSAFAVFFWLNLQARMLIAKSWRHRELHLLLPMMHHLLLIMLISNPLVTNVLVDWNAMVVNEHWCLCVWQIHYQIGTGLAAVIEVETCDTVVWADKLVLTVVLMNHLTSMTISKGHDLIFWIEFSLFVLVVLVTSPVLVRRFGDLRCSH